MSLIQNISILAPQQANLSSKVKTVLNLVQGNDMNLVGFNTKYHAIDTFNYLNTRATGEYKFDLLKVFIWGVAKRNYPANTSPLYTESSVVVVTSR